jgi:O-antigen/teichoic acid export membrane protein
MVKKIANQIYELFGEVGVVFKDTSTIFTATVVGSIALFLANIALSRLFDPEVFGNFKTVLNLALFVPAIIELGAGITLTRYLAEYSTKHKDKSVTLLRFFTKLRVISFVVAIVLIFIFRDIVSSTLLGSGVLSGLLIAGLVVAAASFFDIYKYAINGIQHFKTLAMSSLISYIATGAFTCVGAVLGGVFGALVGWGIGIFIGNILPWIETRKHFKGIKPAKFPLKPILKGYTLPMYLMIIPNFLGIAIIPILSIFFNQTLIGYYSFSLVFFNGIILLPSALYKVLLPKIAMMHGNNQKEEAKSMLKKMLVVYSAISVIGAICTLILSKDIINILSPKYLPGLVVFQYLIITCFIVGFMILLQMYYSAINSVRNTAIVVALQNIIQLAVSFYALTLIVA